MKIYNTLTNSIEEFKEVKKNNVYIYLCGPTVYNDVHIGNLRPVLFCDVLVRYFTHIKKKIHYWQNITDVNEKILQKANNLGLSENRLAKNYSKKYLDILKKINIIMPNKIIHVSENIKLINSYIEKLVSSKNAYINNSGIYFDVNKVKNYGHISNNNPKKTINIKSKNNARKNPYDFALWKFSKLNSFFSKWGSGRPGWHTECASIIYTEMMKENISQIDFHIGGKDLVFPHNENENAQNFSLLNKNLSNYWINVGQIEINKIKMSKSLNNFLLAKDFVKKYGPNVLRFCIFQSTFTKPININEDMIKLAMKKIELWRKEYLFWKELGLLSIGNNKNKDFIFQSTKNNYKKELIFAIENNFNFAIINRFIDQNMKDISLWRKKNKNYSNVFENNLISQKVNSLNSINKINFIFFIMIEILGYQFNIYE